MRLSFILIMTVMLLVITSVAFPSIRDLSKANHHQRDVLYRACQHGKEITFKGQDMCFIMAAIAWRETKAGIKLVGDNGGSIGVFQNQIKTVQKRLSQRGVKRSWAQIKKELFHIDNSAYWAKEELKYWLGRRNNIEIAIRSYNAGNNHSKGRRYANDVLEKAKWLEKNKYPMGLY